MDAVFSEQELTVRKWWLRIFLFQFALNLISCTYRYPFAETANTPLQPFVIATLATSLILGGLFSYGLYHFAYKKQGTKFLTFALVFAWIGFISMSLMFLGSLVSIALKRPVPLSLFANDDSIFEYALSTVAYLLLFPYYYLTVRMRRINRARKLEEKPSA